MIFGLLGDKDFSQKRRDVEIERGRSYLKPKREDGKMVYPSPPWALSTQVKTTRSRSFTCWTGTTPCGQHHFIRQSPCSLRHKAEETVQQSRLFKRCHPSVRHRFALIAHQLITG
jgi:hypothetical protein